MLLASAFLASMGVCVKFASAYFSASELVFYRGIISLLMMGLYARFAGTSLHTPVPLMHFWRNVVGVFSLGAWFYALGKLPLATAMTLNYMSSIWIGAFVCAGAMLYGRSLRQGPLLATVLAGFAGVVMVTSESASRFTEPMDAVMVTLPAPTRRPVSVPDSETPEPATRSPFEKTGS